MADLIVYGMTEAAKILKIDRNTLARLVQRGAIGGVYVGRRWRIRREDLELFLSGKMEPRTTPDPTPTSKAKPKVVPTPKTKPAELKRYGPGSESGAVASSRKRRA